jgi:oligoribonuclease NrnB/cAMP/cGMP phosphodiesterase (DHH superfamily)
MAHNIINLKYLAMINSMDGGSIMTYDIVVYHVNCNDGICSLWCSTHYHKKNKLPEPIKVGLSPASKLDTMKYNIKNKRILFTDVCPPLQSIVNMAKEAKHITIIDHHDTNYRSYNEMKSIIDRIDNITIIMRMDLAACQLTWDYFFKNKKRPWFIDHVGARDMFTQMKYTDEIIKALDSNDMIDSNDLNKLDTLMRYKKSNINKLIDLGKTIIRLNKKIMKDELHRVYEGRIQIKDTSYRVWIGSIRNNLISDFGNFLSSHKFSDNMNPDFVMLWNYNPMTNTWSISLRGSDTSPNLALIAEHFGGGGHPKASGFRLNNGKTIRDIIEFR